MLEIPKKIAKKIKFVFTGYIVAAKSPNDRLSGFRKIPEQYDFVYELEFKNNTLMSVVEILNDPSYHGFPAQDEESILLSAKHGVQLQDNRKSIILKRLKGSYKHYNSN